MTAFSRTSTPPFLPSTSTPYLLCSLMILLELPQNMSLIWWNSLEPLWASISFFWVALCMFCPYISAYFRWLPYFYQCNDLHDFLGIGPDGHTCSLFTNHPALTHSDALVTFVLDSPKPPSKRITLTLPVLNAAQNVAFIVCGDEKKEVVGEIEAGCIRVPASMVSPTSSESIWYLDESAASLLQTPSNLVWDAMI